MKAMRTILGEVNCQTSEVNNDKGLYGWLASTNVAPWQSVKQVARFWHARMRVNLTTGFSFAVLAANGSLWQEIAERAEAGAYEALRSTC
jgi:hypothetical protein